MSSTLAGLSMNSIETGLSSRFQIVLDYTSTPLSNRARTDIVVTHSLLTKK